MKLWAKMAISKKLVFMMMTVCTGAVLISGIAYGLFGLWSFKQQMITGISSQAKMIADNCIAALAFDYPKDAETVLNSLAAIKEIRQAYIYDAKGEIFAAYQRKDQASHQPRFSEHRNAYALDRSGLRRTQTIKFDGRVIGSLYLESDLSLLEATIAKIWWFTLVIVSLIFCFAYVLASRIQRIISKPVASLVETAEQITRHQNYALRAIHHHPDELGFLTDRFNEMVARIEEREMDLKENRDLLQAALESTEDGIWVVDRDGQVSHFNQRFIEIWEIPDEVLGTKRFENFSEHLKSRMQTPEGSTPETTSFSVSGTDGSNTKTLTLANGKIVEQFSRPLAPMGALRGRFWSFTDITEKKLAEDELKHVRSFLSNIIDSMPSMLIGIDARNQVTHWNLESEKFTQTTSHSALGRPLEEVFPQLSDQLKDIHYTLSSGKQQKAEKVAFQVNDDQYYLDIMIYPLLTNGVNGAVLRIDDVTTRVRLEEMMVQTEKMMSVGGLAAGMAHEINNPLGVILQGVQATLRRLSPDLLKNVEIASQCGTSIDQVRDYLKNRNILLYLEGIQEAGGRAAKIVANMLNFSRRSESSQELMDLTQLIDETIELAANDYDLKKKYDFRHILINRCYQPDLPSVPGIRMEIEQVILNILKNAAQAMGQKEEDGYRPQITITTTDEPEYVVIEIADNGPGIEDSIRNRIFEPFFTTKDVGVGTGLGLSVSFFIITNNHQGLINVESKIGKGTRFFIRLPKKSA